MRILGESPQLTRRSAKTAPGHHQNARRRRTRAGPNTIERSRDIRMPGRVRGRKVRCRHHPLARFRGTIPIRSRAMMKQASRSVSRDLGQVRAQPTAFSDSAQKRRHETSCRCWPVSFAASFAVSDIVRRRASGCVAARRRAATKSNRPSKSAALSKSSAFTRWATATAARSRGPDRRPRRP